MRRTLHILLQTYWWSGILKNVASILRQCEICDRAKAAFKHSHQPQLHPLTIEGLFYRIGLDLFGPLPLTKFGFLFVLIAIEHYSKAIVLVPMPSKEAKHVAFAFAQGVLARFGACAEVITDQGREFQGAFDELCARSMIDHRTTSANHPHSNGAAERCVQTVKRSIRRYCENHLKADSWDEHLPYVSLGYNVSRQESTNCAPYQIMYARDPVFMGNKWQKFEGTLHLDPNNDKAADSILQRADYLKKTMPTIANHLQIAQHRDKLRYAMTRDGSYKPKLRRFEVGDYVYMRRHNMHSTLAMQAKQSIYLVSEVRPSGVIIIIGKCGNTDSVQPSELAICHLPFIDGTIHPELATVNKTLRCEECWEDDNEHLLLLCDNCGDGYHTYCLQPELKAIPEGLWLCQPCNSKSITIAELEDRGVKPSRPVRRRRQTSFFQIHSPGSKSMLPSNWMELVCARL